MAYGIPKEMESTILHCSDGRPFHKCGCGASIPESFGQCNECARLKAIGFGPERPKNVPSDTTEAHSYPNNDHSGYSDTIPSGKISKDRGRV